MDIYLVLKMFSEPSRLRILTLLYKKPLTVGEIEKILRLSQANTSKHLKKLLDVGMVRKESCGLNVIYYLNEQYVEQCIILKPIIETFLDHPQGNEDQKIMKEI